MLLKILSTASSMSSVAVCPFPLFKDASMLNPPGSSGIALVNLIMLPDLFLYHESHVVLLCSVLSRSGRTLVLLVPGRLEYFLWINPVN